MNILFTGIGGPTPLGLAKSVKDAFPKFRCIGVDGSKWSTNLYNSDIFDQVHKILPGNNKDYWKRINEVIMNEKVDFAFIVPETEVLIWAEYQINNDLPCKTLIPDFSLAEFCFDKNKVAHFLFDLGLTPKTIDYKRNLNFDKNSQVGFPFWMRVKSGAGALGAMKIESQKDFETWLNIHDYRDDFMISEFLPGRNYACKLLYLDSKLLQHASAERIDYLLSSAAPSGISGMCSRGKLLNRPDLVEKSIMALEAIAKKTKSNLNGIFTVDFKEDKSGLPLITEINIRHVSFNYAFSLGGVNFAKTTLNEVLNLNLKSDIINEFSIENYFIRGVDAPIRLIP